MIFLESISKTYNPSTAMEVKALCGINLTISEGEFVMLIGANGSGKSTLVKMLSGSEFPSKGKVFINGKDVTVTPDYKRSKVISKIFQDPLQGTASELSVLHNFRLAYLRTQHKGLGIGINRAFRELVKHKISVLGMGLEDKLDQNMGTLSGGQRQALTLLMSTFDSTKFLLLDEPTAALDPLTADTVMLIADKIIKEKKLTSVCVTHNLDYAIKFGSRLILMRSGEIVKDVSNSEKQNLTKQEIYSWFD